MLDSVKCVLVGDSAVGKTSLLVRFTSETFPDDYRPTVYENTGVDVFMDGVQISLGLWDTSGSDAFKGIRPLSYQQADVVLMCYSVANHNSFLNLRNKWISEIRSHLPRIPVLVVATQTDQRDMGPYSSSCISPIDGKRLAQDVRAKGYLECSALSNRGVQQVFEYAVRTAVNQAKRQNRRKLFSINECKIFWGLSAVVLLTFVLSVFSQRHCSRGNGRWIKGRLLAGPQCRCLFMKQVCSLSEPLPSKSCVLSWKMKGAYPYSQACVWTLQAWTAAGPACRSADNSSTDLGFVSVNVPQLLVCLHLHLFNDKIVPGSAPTSVLVDFFFLRKNVLYKTWSTCILFRGLLDILLKITNVYFNILVVLPLANHRNELSYPCNKWPAGKP